MTKRCCKIVPSNCIKFHNWNSLLTSFQTNFDFKIYLRSFQTNFHFEIDFRLSSDSATAQHTTWRSAIASTLDPSNPGHKTILQSNNPTIQQSNPTIQQTNPKNEQTIQQLNNTTKNLKI
jgi:hypothetical protein